MRKSKRKSGRGNGAGRGEVNNHQHSNNSGRNHQRTYNQHGTYDMEDRVRRPGRRGHRDRGRGRGGSHNIKHNNNNRPTNHLHNGAGQKDAEDGAFGGGFSEAGTDYDDDGRGEPPSPFAFSWSDSNGRNHSQRTQHSNNMPFTELLAAAQPRAHTGPPPCHECLRTRRANRELKRAIETCFLKLSGGWAAWLREVGFRDARGHDVEPMDWEPTEKMVIVIADPNCRNHQGRGSTASPSPEVGGPAGQSPELDRRQQQQGGGQERNGAGVGVGMGLGPANGFGAPPALQQYQHQQQQQGQDTVHFTQQVPQWHIGGAAVQHGAEQTGSANAIETHGGLGIQGHMGHPSEYVDPSRWQFREARPEGADIF
ncbi:uncharacterized protein JN550_008695 [Neoarthrinium moseri]|uniref:uncharacterized protein n=1 Tax=Neoarthrinium moseri TaxID=1658444 RepID=UPI001FDB77BF|nr:uncharacterized protein JN550_008695 [Neoarthrinium moseri]KAI1864875.1 hypothetical protein JN550_008695 [Neoarthrinium moseri]